MNMESSLSRDADDCDAKGVHPPHSTGAVVPCPAPNDRTMIPDAPTCEYLRRWSHDRLKSFGLSLPGAMAGALRDICSQNRPTARREEALQTALALLDGVPPTPEITELHTVLTRLYPACSEPHHQAGTGSVEEARPAPTDSSCSGQQEAVAAQQAAVDTPTKVIPVAKTITDAESQARTVADTVDAPTKKATVAAAVTGAETQILEVEITSIVVDEDVQPRERLSEETIAEYAEDMRRGARFPPIILFGDPDGGELILGDGFHRVKAAQVAGLKALPAEVKVGTRDDARWYAIGTNRVHGLRRTNADKRRAAELALTMHPEYSDRALADHCGVSSNFIGDVRRQVSSDYTSGTRLGQDGKRYPGITAARDGSIPIRPATAPSASGESVAMDNVGTTGTTDMATESSTETILPKVEAPVRTNADRNVNPTAEQVLIVVADLLIDATSGATPLDCLAKIASTLQRRYPLFHQRVQHLLPVHAYR